jgi:hypothetical protein
MKCAEFDLWLDQGSPAAGQVPALAHARGCARCAAALESARALDVALAEYSIAAPPQFTARVMERVRRTPRPVTPARARGYDASAPAMEWWVRAAADPATALALVAAGLLAWRSDAVQHAALALAQGLLANLHLGLDRLPSVPAPALPRLAFPFGDPNVTLALLLACAPATLWISWCLFAWTERACVPFVPPRARGPAMSFGEPGLRSPGH